jgi:C4-type Zn-finger protein
MTGISVKVCVRCGADMITPQWSAHLPDRCVRNVWSCEACGYQLEDTVCFATHEATDADPIFASFLFV